MMGEVDVPDIRWSTLSQPMQSPEGGMEPPYDPTTFARAVRVGSFSGLIFPNLALRLEPVSTCLTFATASLLVEFVGPGGDLRSEIARLLASTRGLRLGRTPDMREVSRGR